VLQKTSDLEGYEKSIWAIKSYLDGKRYNGTPFGKKLLAIALAMVMDQDCQIIL
jgi:hypothetical protein